MSARCACRMVVRGGHDAAGRPPYPHAAGGAA
jgi:hypothetical protein